MKVIIVGGVAGISLTLGTYTQPSPLAGAGIRTSSRTLHKLLKTKQANPGRFDHDSGTIIAEKLITHPSYRLGEGRLLLVGGGNPPFQE